MSLFEGDGRRCEGVILGVGGAAVLLRRLLRFHFERTPALLFRFWRVLCRPPRKAWPFAASERLRLLGDDAQDEFGPSAKRSEILLHRDRVLRRILRSVFGERIDKALKPLATSLKGLRNQASWDPEIAEMLGKITPREIPGPEAGLLYSGIAEPGDGEAA